MPRGVYKRTPEILASLKAAAEARSTDTGWCQELGCDQRSAPKRANVCERHYMQRRRREQNPLAYVRVIYRRACPTCGQVFSPRKGVTYCSHSCASGRERNPSWKGEGIGYGAAHERVRNWRGPASALMCVDCGKQAKHWSLDDERGALSSDYGPYSVDPAAYVPRCVPCHKRHDLKRCHSRKTMAEVRA